MQTGAGLLFKFQDNPPDLTGIAAGGIRRLAFRWLRVWFWRGLARLARAGGFGPVSTGGCAARGFWRGGFSGIWGRGWFFRRANGGFNGLGLSLGHCLGFRERGVNEFFAARALWRGLF